MCGLLALMFLGLGLVLVARMIVPDDHPIMILGVVLFGGGLLGLLVQEFFQKRQGKAS